MVTLLCDPGERYLDTYFDDGWLAARGYDIAPARARLERFLAEGHMSAEGQV